MVDELTQDGVTPESQAPAGDEPPAQDADEWFKEAQGKGFKDKASVWKSYTEAEKKISSQGESLKKFEEFQQDVAPVLDIIWNDPELLEKVRAKASGKTPEPVKKDDKVVPPPPQVDVTARNVLRTQTISKFEEDTGISKLDDASKKEVRQAIGKAMTRWVRPGEELPVENLREIFEDALIIAQKKDSKLNKMLGEIEESGSDGAFSSMGSGGSNSEDVRLSPEQEKVASHMPGGVEKYKAGLKKLIKK